MSGAVRQLIQMSFITRERLPGSRKDHYRIREDVFAAILERRNQALTDWATSSAVGAELFGADTVVGRRLSEAADFISFVHSDLEQTMKDWRAKHPL